MQIKCDFILIILNCYKYREKAIRQKNTWLKDLPSNIKYYHIIGDKEKCGENDILIEENENIIYTNTLDDYNSLPAKVITALNGIRSAFDFKYIFKTDDDQMLIQPAFFTDLPNYLTNNVNHHYGGFIVKVDDHISKYYTVHDCLPRDLLLKKCLYCNGRFYMLSKPAIENLLTKKSKISQHIIEDHAIGLYLDDKYKENMLYFDSRLVFNDDSMS
jgi:hypothetical protein